MDSLYELVAYRRSCRAYTEEKISAEAVQSLLACGLYAPSSRNRHSCHFIVSEDAGKIAKLSYMREHGAAFLKGVPLVIIVTADPMLTRHWVEDASIAAAFIQLQAEDSGLGSCWCQVNDMLTSAGQDASEYVRRIFNIPLQLQILCVLAIGHKAGSLIPRPETDLTWEQVHLEGFPKEDGEPRRI